MKSEFVIVHDRRSYTETAIDSRLIRAQGLFKTLSLFEARRAGVNIPRTLLLLDRSFEVLKDVISRWSLPLMIRMDYGSLPASKPLGGIPIHSFTGVKSVSEYLFQERLYPLFHPLIDRFSDIYSTGILLTKESPDIQVEVVGCGFDASDLRLGTANPHESFAYNIVDDSISNRTQISHDDYQREKAERAKQIARLQCYVDFANQEGRLLPSLTRFKPSREKIMRAGMAIPNNYTPLGRREIGVLAGLARKLQTDVLPSLPKSESFVASFSLVPDHGWILWDVYGHWYRR